MIRALIVGDDYPARMELRRLLGKFDQLTVMGEAVDPDEAAELARAVGYAAVFLDVSGADLNGCHRLVELLQQLPSPPLVVLFGGSEQLALEAFEVGAIDYLLKPLEEGRVGRAVAKISGLVQGPVGKQAAEPADPHLRLRPENAAGPVGLDLVPVEKNGKTILLNPKDVVFAFAEDDYVYLKLYKDRILTHYTLRDLEARFEPFHFFRCHRTYLINLRRIKEIIPHSPGSYRVVLDDHERTQIPVSRTKRKRLKAVLGL